MTTISDTLDTVTTTNYDWKQLQASDDTITKVKVLIKDKDAITTDATPKVKNLMKHKDKLFLFKDLLYYQQEENSQKRLVVPDSQQADIVKLYHSFGHFGITRVLKLLQERFFWTNMKV